MSASTSIWSTPKTILYNDISTTSIFDDGYVTGTIVVLKTWKLTTDSSASSPQRSYRWGQESSEIDYVS